jgi:hypothetical protein
MELDYQWETFKKTKDICMFYVSMLQLYSSYSQQMTVNAAFVQLFFLSNFQRRFRVVNM